MRPEAKNAWYLDSVLNEAKREIETTFNTIAHNIHTAQSGIRSGLMSQEQILELLEEAKKLTR